VNLLAGIEQTDVAWAKIRLRPFYSKTVDHVKAVVPSPRGPIEAEWRRENGAIKGSLKLPKGVEVELQTGDVEFDVVEV
jgi:hypothetical protein